MILKLAASSKLNFVKKLSILPDYHYIRPIKKALEEIHVTATKAIKTPSTIDDLHKAQALLREKFKYVGPEHEYRIKAALTKKRNIS
jgi:hypothetical protein